MRLATIDLDWLEADIAEYKRVINDNLVSDELATMYNTILSTFILVRSKCTLIEAPKEQELQNYCVVKNKEYCFLSGKCKECSTVIEEPFISKTCINNWESAKYCQNENKCQMCVTKNKQ